MLIQSFLWGLGFVLTFECFHKTLDELPVFDFKKSNSLCDYIKCKPNSNVPIKTIEAKEIQMFAKMIIERNRDKSNQSTIKIISPCLRSLCDRRLHFK